jgi:hypothetical protein
VTLHLQPVERPKLRCDTRALKDARERARQDLERTRDKAEPCKSVKRRERLHYIDQH